MYFERSKARLCHPYPRKEIIYIRTALADKQTYLVDNTSFVEIPVGLDAVWDVKIAGVTA